MAAHNWPRGADVMRNRKARRDMRVKLWVRIPAGVALILLLLGPVSAAEEKSFRASQDLIDHLTGLTRCSKVVPDVTDVYCRLEFRGLVVEFAGVNSAGGGSIYVHKLGEQQSVGFRGGRCLEVWFSQADLRFPENHGIPTILLMRVDGQIFSAKDKKLRATCYQ